MFEAELLLETIDDKGRARRYGSIGGSSGCSDLVARFTGQPLPATGFSFGVVAPLASALRAAGRMADAPVRGPVVVIVFSQANISHYLFEAVAELRNAGIAAELYLGRAQDEGADEMHQPARVAQPPSCSAATRSRRVR